MPDLSLLVPLEDARGDAASHIRTWTEEQSLDRDRYQVIVVSPGHDPADEAAIEAILGPGDVLERLPGANLQELWNAAAARADSDWIMLTENHCEGDPACLAQVARAIEREPERDAFTLRHGHITATPTGELNARWFDEILDEWTAPGEWARLNLVGFAIRKRLFQEEGGLHPDYGLFAGPLLSARVHERGAQVGHVEEAQVLHIHPDDIQEHHHYSADFARGECLARLEQDPFFCERYFGPAAQWRNRMLLRPEVARHALRVLGDSAVRALARRREELPWLLRELGRIAPAAVAGARPHARRDRVLFSLSERAASRLPLSPEARWKAFLAAQDQIVRLTTYEAVEDLRRPLAAPPSLEGELPVQALHDDTLAGVHGLERQGERWFRWTQSLAVLRAELPKARAELRVETGGVRGMPLAYVRGVYVDGRRVPPGALRAEGTTLVAPLPPRPAAGPAMITLLARPLMPSRSGSSDPRRLGIPIFSVGLGPACESS